ncbi:MAG TPA: response regulator transcription factor [Solirubrobacteraceae bacterium]
MAPSTPITVVLSEFGDLLARGLRELIQSDHSLAIVAAGVEHKRIPVVLRAHRPGVAILDAGALAKLAEVRELSGGHPGTRLILLANDLSAAECAQLLAFGASACLSSNTQSRDVLNAIHLASRGLQVVPRTASGPRGGPAVVGGMLTRREAEVLPLLQLGRSNAQIALALQVGIETVRTHARNIYRKLGVSSRRELSALPGPALRHGPTSPIPSPRRRSAMLRTRPRRGDGLRHD